MAGYLDQAEWVGVPTITLGELRTGFLLGAHVRRNEADLQEFLAHPAVEVLAVDKEASEHYSAIMVDLRRAGTPLPTNDIWIAAVAARHGALVLTFDSHFASITRVGSLILEVDN